MIRDVSLAAERSGKTIFFLSVKGELYKPKPLCIILQIWEYSLQAVIDTFEMRVFSY